MMKKALILMILLAFAAPVWPAMAAEKGAEAKPATLTERDRKDIARIGAYLNNLKSVSADFLQVSDRGDLRYGTIAIQRPGKMRVAYNPPQPDLIIADGSTVHIWDAEMKTQTNVPVGDGIAQLILREAITLDGDVTITHFVRFPAKMELSVVATNAPGDGELTLIFEDKPLALRQWRVLDAQGHTTGVNLQNAREDVSFPDGTFSFIPPTLGKPQRGNG